MSWDCIFEFVARIGDKKPEFNGENGITSMPPSFFFFFSSFSLTRETGHSSQILVHTVHCIICTKWVLGLKNHFKRRFFINRVGPYGPVQILIPLIKK